MRVDDDLIQRKRNSEMYSEYETAFEDATGIPLAIRPMESRKLAHRNRRNEDRFCAMLAETNRTCAACLESEQQAADAATDGPATVTCFTGKKSKRLSETEDKAEIDDGLLDQLIKEY